MASSQVQMASAHFGCVLRDHNWRHRDRDKERETNNVQAQNLNLKVLVRNHLHSCITLPISNENSENQVDRNEETQVENESSSPMTRKQSRVVDRWATRQAQEMSTTMERQTHEAELLALSNSHPVSTVASTFLAESPRAPSETSVDHLPNLPTSSLVQKWREFEAESKLTSGNHSSFKSNLTICSGGRLDSGTSNIDNASSVEDPSPRSEVCDSGDEIFEDSLADWDSEQNTPRERRSRVSLDIEESEKLRVVDIIRRWTSGKPIKMCNSKSSSSDEADREQPSVIDPLPEQGGEQRGFLIAGKSPRVRGRQAMMDLLMQMERERQRELNELEERRAVSRFPQRGRIQSMLKLRFLKREVAAQGQQTPPSAASELGRLQRGTSILALRQKFSPNRNAGEVHVEESGDNSNSHTQVPQNTTDSEHSGTSSQLMNEKVHHQLVARIEQGSTPSVHQSMPSSSEDLREEAGQSSDSAWQGRSLVVSDLAQEGSINTATASHDSEASGLRKEPDSDTKQQHVGSTDETWLGDVSNPQRDWRDSVQSWYQDLHANNSEDGERNVVTDELEPGVQQHTGSKNGAWLGDVSHSQRDWMHSRQAWYEDVLDNNSEDGERNVVTAEQESDTQQLAGSTDRTWLADGTRVQTDWRGQSWYLNVPENNSEDGEGNVVTDEPDPNTEHLEESADRTWLADGAHVQTDWRGQSWYQNVPVNNSEDGEGNVVTDEPYPDTELLEESTDGTWLGNVSHPPRDWRRSRQEWYQEVLENSSENGEIRELLQRRSVSNFLASDLRETIDQMIKSCLQRQTHQSESVGGEENLFDHPYARASDASDHFASTSFNLPLAMSYNLPLPPQLRLRDWYQDHEVGNNSNQVALTSLQSSSSHYQDNLQSSIYHPSLEMDLISDLRGHMLQLHNEISELRKSMESCMDRQNQLQYSIKKEVSAAVYNSVHGGEATELFNWVPVRKGKCCICYEMQVDSLLYRCGHMCTCFKCAHELQWSSGRCPICRAPILDVVRAYFNS